MITQQEYRARGTELSREAQVLDTLHHYFLQQVTRLHQTCALFGLFDRQLGEVLDIGPFYSYTPFVLRAQAGGYTVLEGDDPAAYPLKPIYERHRVRLHFIDLFDVFGPTRDAWHALEFPDASFDTVLCWETMEHFNFNPVKFVRELRRVLRPGGQACITVPNRASFQNLVGLARGGNDGALVQSYYRFEDYESGGKKAFFGFHWHEYTVTELRPLFAQAGFDVRECSTMVAFQEHAASSATRRMARGLNRLAAGMFPRFGTHVYLRAEK